MVSPQSGLVTDHLRAALSSCGSYRAEASPLLVLQFVAEAFAGLRPGYQASDMRYHDFHHTLQATVCAADLLSGQASSGEAPDFTPRHAELTLVAALLHDVGFLKHTDDTSGTGAKYTGTHEQRSCSFARTLLPELGFAPADIEAVCAVIACTGPRNRISAQRFASPTIRRMASIVVTADYLSQMSAPDYPAKLPALFAEFEEAAKHDQLTREQRPFPTLEALLRGTEAFWRGFVMPLLDSEAEGVHRFLALTGQPNPYFAAVEANLAVIRQRTT